MAGTGFRGYAGDGGPATTAQLDHPYGIAVGADGSLYIADLSNQRVRRVDGKSGTITTVAGTGLAGYSGDGGPATAAQLSYPSGVAVAADGTLYIADRGNQRVRKVSPAGTISTLAGSGAADYYGGGFGGDGGPAAAAQLSQPIDVALGPDGSVYVADYGNHRIRRTAPDGTITTVAGNGTTGNSGDGGPATAAQLQSVTSVAVGADGAIYLAMGAGGFTYAVRKVAPDGTITTVIPGGGAACGPTAVGDGGPAGSAQVCGPYGVAAGTGGPLVIAEYWGHRVRQVAPDGIVSTLAGNGTDGHSGDGGPATAAQLRQPRSVAVAAGGVVYVSDEAAHVVRRIVPANFVPTATPTPVPTAVVPATPVPSNTFMIVGGSAVRDGQPAAAGTLVQAVCHAGIVAGQALTGSGSGLAPDGFRLTVYGDAGTGSTGAATYCRDGDPVEFWLGGSAATVQEAPVVWTSNGSAVVTLSATSQPASQALTLASGWNLIGPRVAPGPPAPTTLVTASGSTIDILIGFDAAVGQARAYFTDPAKAVLNSLAEIEPGMGYWVHTTQATTVAVAGTAPAGTVTRSLAQGWNLAGWQATDRRPLASAFGALLGPDVDILIGFDAAAGQARAYFTDPAKRILNSLTHLEAGAGYWLHTTKATTWSYSP